jgi:hypothetical protein
MAASAVARAVCILRGEGCGGQINFEQVRAMGVIAAACRCRRRAWRWRCAIASQYDVWAF